jgi:PadR family transcriptional regulator PadR
MQQKINAKYLDKHTTMHYIVYGENMENKTTQLRKGILELAILGSLSHGRRYGYSLVRSISGGGDVELTEGTIYPILNRLSKEGLLRSEWVESSQGPPRKYYTLTPSGEETYRVLDGEFRKLADMVANAREAVDTGADDEDKGAPLAVRKETHHG